MPPIARMLTRVSGPTYPRSPLRFEGDRTTKPRRMAICAARPVLRSLKECRQIFTSSNSPCSFHHAFAFSIGDVLARTMLSALYQAGFVRDEDPCGA
jgi:hypothetical protein